MVALGLCFPRIVQRDNTLTNIIITPSCLEACDNYESDGDSVDSEENSINHYINDLNRDSGVRSLRVTHLPPLILPT
jgi:hypothetical protein